MQRLFEDFTPVSREEWEAKALKDLRGKTLQDLTSTTRDGIEIKPFYTEANVKPQPQKPKTGWDVIQEILVMNEAEANAQALDALNRGANGLLFYMNPEVDFNVLLAEISLPHIAMHFVSEENGREVLLRLLAYAEKSESDINTWNFTINKDCFENALRTGNYFETLEEDLADLQEMVDADIDGFKSVCINANIYHNSGATVAEELAIALAQGHEYLTKLEIKDASKFWFNFAIGPNYFEQIAKFRAFRRVWNNVLTQYGIETTPTSLYAETGSRNKTIFDSHVNLLRTTTEAMSAVLGGADQVCIKPFDTTYNPTSFGERIARNQQLLLEYESYFSKINDPAAGAYFIENLTEEIAQKAWSIFQDIEAHGGFLKGIEDGSIQERILTSARSEQEAFDNNNISLLGTNLYPNKEEKMADKLVYPQFYKETTSTVEIEPLQTKRLAEKLEQARLETEKGEA